MGAHGIAFGEAEDRHGEARRLEEQGRRPAHERPRRRWRSSARCASCAARRVSRRRSSSRSSTTGERALVDFDQCIIAAGSEPAMLPGLPNDPRIIDSTGALELKSLPERMLVVGGGIIGLEMATVYDALGVKVSVVELTKTLIPGCDRDLVKPLEKRIAARYEAIMLGTRVHEDGSKARRHHRALRRRASAGGAADLRARARRRRPQRERPQDRGRQGRRRGRASAA